VTISGTPTAGGTYTLTTTGGHSSCAAATIQGTITVNPLPVATITPSGSTELCDGEDVTLTASAGASYLWTPGSTTSQDLVVSATGSYTVTVTDANSCSATSAATVVNVYAAPTINLTSGLANQTVCDGIAIGAIEFTLGGSASNVNVSGLPVGLTSNLSGSTLTISGTPTAGGTYSISTTGQNAACAAATIGGTITVNVPAQATISAGGPTDFCEGGSVQLTASAGSSYLWSPGAATTQDITVSSTGNYTVTVTDGNGCQSTSLVTAVVEHPAPTVVFATGDLNQTLCAGNALVTTTFTLGGGATGADVTNLPAGLTASVSSGTVTISGNPTASATYTVTTTGQNAVCTAATIDGEVTVNQLPVVTISAGGPIEFCQGGSVVLSSSEAAGNTWSTTATSQDITVNASGSYTVSVTDGNGCTGTSAATVVTVYAQPTLALAGASNPASQSVCPGASISAITYDFGGSATGVNVTGLPTGVSANVSGSSVTITGTPGFTGTYTVSTTGQDLSCAAAELTGTLTVYPAPVASISAGGPVDLCAGGSVTLTASGGTSYVWSTTEITPSINVSSSGSFTVTATDVNGCVATSAATVVTVYQAPTITYASGPLTQDLCAGQAITDVTFTLGGSATGVNATGLPSGISANVSGSTVTVSGTSSADGIFNYTLSTTGQNALCAAADVSGTIELYALPVAPTISAGGPTTFCDGGSVQLTSSVTSGNTWSPSGETTQSITVTVDGSYTVTVTDGNGCQAISSPELVTVNPLPTATIVYADAPFCPDGIGLVTQTGQVGGIYSSTSGLDINSANGSIDLEASTPGVYTVTYSFSDLNGCANTTTTQVIVVPLPTATISYTGTPFCATGVATVTRTGAEVGTYSGTSGLVIDVNTGEIDLETSVPGTHVVTYTFTNENPPTSGGGPAPPPPLAVCSNTTTTTVVINALPNVQAGADVAICIGQSVQLNATGASSYAWSPSANLDNNAIADPTFNGSATTVLTVVGTDANSCQNSDDVTVTVNALPSVSVTPAGSTTFCDGGSLNLDAGAGWSSHVWNEGGTPITPAETAQIFVADASGSYTVTVTDANGCSATSAAVAVTVNPLPTATINPAPTAAFCGDGVDDVELTASGGGTYQWQRNTLDIAGETGASIAVNVAGDYTVVVTDGNGCSQVSSVTAVTENEPSELLIDLGASSPTVCAGEAIPDIVYVFSGSADNAGVTGLPAGLSASVDVIAKTVTITGTPTAGGTYTVTTSGHVAPCDAATVSGTVTVNTASIVDAGGTQSVCESSSPSAMTLTGASIGGGATTGTWSIFSGTGTLSSTDPVANPAAVTFTPAADFYGIVELVLITDAESECPEVSDTLTVEVRERPRVVMSSDEQLCPHPMGISDFLQGLGEIAGSADEGQWSIVTPNPLPAGLTMSPSSPSGFLDSLGLLGVEAAAAAGVAENLTVVFLLETNDPLGCGPASGTVEIVFSAYAASTTWTGAMSTDWFDNDNWTDCVPGPGTDAIIPDPSSYVDPANDPVINGFDAQCNRIFIQGNAELTIQGSWQLNVNF
jgi:large repetitive protein